MKTSELVIPLTGVQVAEEVRNFQVPVLMTVVAAAPTMEDIREIET